MISVRSESSCLEAASAAGPRAGPGRGQGRGGCRRDSVRTSELSYYIKSPMVFQYRHWQPSTVTVGRKGRALTGIQTSVTLKCHSAGAK
eukprot:764483-Hanusia_phi.AAC.5